MSKMTAHAIYLFEHYKQTHNQGFVEMLFDRIVKAEKLKLWEAKALANEFKKLLKNYQVTV
jgi:hypothetical protein